MLPANFRLTRFENGKAVSTAALTEMDLNEALTTACDYDHQHAGIIMAGAHESKGFELRDGDRIIFAIDKIFRSTRLN